MRVLVITLLILMFLPGIKTPAKEPSFGERISEIVQTHKIMTDRLIAMWERRQAEINLLAEVIYWENWYTDKDKRAAYLTGAVVMNRVNSPKWPNTVKAVAYQKGQYSTTKYFYTKEIPEECYDMARDIYKNGTPDVPYNLVFQATFTQGFGDWGDPINGEHFCLGNA